MEFRVTTKSAWGQKKKSNKNHAEIEISLGMEIDFCVFAFIFGVIMKIG